MTQRASKSEDVPAASIQVFNVCSRAQLLRFAYSQCAGAGKWPKNEQEGEAGEQPWVGCSSSYGPKAPVRHALPPPKCNTHHCNALYCKTTVMQALIQYVLVARVKYSICGGSWREGWGGGGLFMTQAPFLPLSTGPTSSYDKHSTWFCDRKLGPSHAVLAFCLFGQCNLAIPTLVSLSISDLSVR